MALACCIECAGGDGQRRVVLLPIAGARYRGVARGAPPQRVVALLPAGAQVGRSQGPPVSRQDDPLGGKPDVRTQASKLGYEGFSDVFAVKDRFPRFDVMLAPAMSPGSVRALLPTRALFASMLHRSFARPRGAPLPVCREPLVRCGLSLRYLGAVPGACCRCCNRMGPEVAAF